MGSKGGGLGTTLVLAAAARKNGVLDAADRNAQSSIRAFVTTLGFERVRFE